MFRNAGFMTSTMCRIMFNTAFIPRNNCLVAHKMNLSPEDIRKDKGKVLPHDFTIYVFFEDFCKTCNSYDTEIEDLCDTCKHEIGE